MTRILFIRYKRSKNIFEGGEQCSQRNHDALASIVGHDNIETIFIHDENIKRTIWDYLKGLFWFPFNYYFGLSPKRVRRILKTAKDYDVLYIDRSIFGIIAKKAVKSGYNGKIICFFHNVEKYYFRDKIGCKPWRPLVIRCAERNERFCCRYASKIIALNTRDSNLIEKLYGRKADFLAPISFKDKYNLDKYPDDITGEKPLCLFLGAYFTANNEGLEWFVRNVYPHVNISLRVVGKGMDKIASRDFITPEIEVVGNAPDLLPHFEEADIMVLPIFKGSGMKVKTCESLMYGKNIIGTDEAFEGYKMNYDRVGAKCNTAGEFIAAIKNFEENPRPRFNSYSREIFLNNYSEEAVQEVFGKIFNK